MGISMGMDSVSYVIEQTFRQDAGQILATLIATVRDFTLAEDALQDALVLALQRWPAEGVPRNPPAWLTTIARRRAIDRLRRDSVGARKRELLQAEAALEQDEARTAGATGDEEPAYPDERLKLLFTCCHPA